MYERFFGLGDAPFRLTPDPRYLFLSRKHADALAHLRSASRSRAASSASPATSAPARRRVLRHFLASSAPEASVAYVVNPTLSPLELLQTINLEFGLPGGEPSKKELIDRLNRHLLAQRQAGRRAVVVIDEAQALVDRGAGAPPTALEPRDDHREAAAHRPGRPAAAPRRCCSIPSSRS